MNAWSRKFTALIATLACTAALAAGGRSVEAFDRDTWRGLKSGLAKPAVVVFSATWCPNCPGVINDLAAQLRQRKLDATLMAVVTDVAPGEQDEALLHDKHYQNVSRLFAFDGQAPALRHGVDPSWRGVVPYVVFLSATGAPPIVVTGTPDAKAVDAWAKGFKPARSSP
ncbi:conserved exported hypothetical protein [Rubrivivax sp. A210]|uniref:hypothetical protein n=1 Tax=Rubrivivax sp. A210 TaxID=2772301 RepID=UPI0019181391|nr:hypothetical protein [Rubrivivax sp. A210]CAD5373826.1 conserved exported hypothetical protein [Rubrivivax sp. A210]